MVFKFLLASMLALTVSVYSGGASISPSTECNTLLDVVLVVDGSGSIGSHDFIKMKSALESFVLSLNVRPNNTRVGLVLFDTRIADKIDISGNATYIISRIRSLIQPGGGTDTASAIAEMDNMVAAQRRPGVPVVGVVITDGRSNDKNATAREAADARRHGINMFAIGVGNNTNSVELKSIASNDQQVLTSNDFNQLGSILSTFTHVVCQTTTPVPTTISSSTECDSLLDVVLVVDGSGSIGSHDFIKMKSALESFVLSLNVRPNNTRVGLVLFSSFIADKIDISGNATYIISRIRSLIQPAGGTDTASAIAEMDNMVAAHSRPGVPVVGVVITDGNSNDKNATAREAVNARRHGINMFAIGVGNNTNSVELKSIASNDQQVLSSNDFNQLGSILSKFTQVVCQKCNSLLDVVLVVDGSGSIDGQDFIKMKSALESFVLSLNVRPNNTRVGLVLFDTRIADKIDISGDATYIISRIRSLIQPGGGTRTALAIAEMDNMVAAHSRPGVPVVGVVITDGRSSDKNATAREAANARRHGINMFAIGVGNHTNSVELKSIASNDQQVLSSYNFNQLGSILFNFTQVVCQTTTTITTTTTTTPAPTDTTTTTPAPTITTTTTPAPTTTTTVKPDPCADCKMSNNIGYNSHPTDCDKYFQCYFGSEGLTNYFVRQCQHGSFWDQHLLTCNYPEAVQCPNDPCKKYIPSYKSAGNCREYYSCSNGTSVAECCKIGFAYVSGQCAPNSNCNADCKEDYINSTCDMREVSGDISSFEQFDSGAGWVRKSCAPGSAFSPVECGCSVNINTLPPKPQECKAELYIPFDNDVADKSGHWNYVENEGVVVTNGEGYFNGSSGLRIPRFSNFEFGSKLLITMRYRSESISGSQGLISNADCGKTGSLLIAINNTNALFELRTVSDTVGSVTIPSANGWNEISYQFDGGVLTGRVNNNTVQKTIVGAIQKSQCALQVGRAFNLSNFRGYIDELKVYLC